MIRVLAAWVAMLVLGAILWYAGGHRLVTSPTPTPTPVATAASAGFAGRWVELAGTGSVLVVSVSGAGLQVANEGAFEPVGAGFEQVVGDTIRRLELDDDGNLQFIQTQLGNEGQRRTVRAFTPEPEGDVPADPKQASP